MNLLTLLIAAIVIVLVYCVVRWIKLREVIKKRRETRRLVREIDGIRKMRRR